MLHHCMMLEVIFIPQTIIAIGKTLFSVRHTVCRSTNASETLALVDGFDQAFITKHELQRILGVDVLRVSTGTERGLSIIERYVGIMPYQDDVYVDYSFSISYYFQGHDPHWVAPRKGS